MEYSATEVKDMLTVGKLAATELYRSVYEELALVNEYVGGNWEDDYDYRRALRYVQALGIDDKAIRTASNANYGLDLNFNELIEDEAIRIVSNANYGLDLNFNELIEDESDRDGSSAKKE
jgi:hypothetical protein